MDTFNHYPSDYDGSLVAISTVLAMFISFLGAAIIFIWKKDQVSPMTRQALAGALNFSISYALWMLLSGLSIFFLVGLLLFPIVVIAYYGFGIYSIIKNGRGEPYTPPFTIHLIR